MAEGNRKMVSVDIHEFVRTRDALTSGFMHLSGAIDQAVKAYIDHTNTVIYSGGTLDVGKLLQPFQAINAQTQLLQQQALAGMANHALQFPVANGLAAPEEGTNKRKRAKRAYKPRDPNAPKRPVTAYFRFLAEQRKEIAAEMGKGGQPGDITKRATDKWGRLTDAQKEAYKQAYLNEIDGYDKKMAEYKANGGMLPEDEVKGGDSGDALTLEGAPKDVNAGKYESDESTDDDTDEESEDDKPAPPPKVPSPLKEPAKTPKSAMKKVAKHQFSSINQPSSISSAEPAKSTSPELKRKASGEAANGVDGKKKKRKSKGGEAVAIAEPLTPVVEPPPAESEKKTKGGRKKKVET